MGCSRQRSDGGYRTATAAAVVVWILAAAGGASAQSAVPAVTEPAEPVDEEAVELTPQPRPDEEAELEGQSIARYDLRCDLAICDDAARVQRLKQISGVAVGDTYRRRDVERAQRRLAKTGFFRQLDVEWRLESDGVHIEIDARGAVMIRQIRFEGLRPPPFESELRKVLMYRSGQVFEGDDEQVRAQLQSLEGMFAGEGYFGTEISLRTEPVGDDRHLVDLVFEVEPGQRRRICAMGFRGVRAMSAAEARELMLTGVPVFARRLPLFLPHFTADQFRTGREALIDDYRRRGYFRARVIDQSVQVDDDSNCAQLVVDISEGPHWAIEFDGNEHTSDDELREELPFAQSGYVDDNEIRAAERSLRRFYQAQGHPFAELRGREESDSRFERRLMFDIDEGPQVQIQAVEFRGMEAFDPSEVMADFGTRPFGLLDAGGYLQIEQLLADLDALEERYRRAGYMQAVVERFAVMLDDDQDAMTIWIYVDEGERTIVDDIEIRGNRSLPTEQLLDQLDVAAGDSFQPLEVHADQSRLTRHYGSIGYPQARIETSCLVDGDREVPCQAPQMPQECMRTNFDDLVDHGCRWRDSPAAAWVCDRVQRSRECAFDDGVTDQVVRVRHDVVEGPKARVGAILLKGNFRTREGVIFRELPLETGDVLDVEKLIDGQGNMRSLGLFDSVSIETIGLDGELDEEASNPEQADGEQERTASLIVSVEESRSRFADVRFGVEGRQLLADSRRLLATGELQYSDENLFGTGQRFRPRLIGALDTLDIYGLGADTTREIETAAEVTGLDYLVGAELIYNHPRFLRGQTGVDELFLTVTPFYLVDLLGVTTEQVLREEWGLRLELRKELPEVLDGLFAKMGLELKQAATWSPGDLRVDGDRVFSPRRATGKLLPELTLDRRDSPLNPRDGYHVRLRPQLVSGDALAQSGEEMIDDSYWRLLGSGSYFHTLFDTLTVGQGLEVAKVVPLFERTRPVPPDERFYLGGIGSVRGFPANSLGPMGTQQQPVGGEFFINYSAELRYPLLEEWGLWGATFFDSGILVDCFDDEGNRTTRQCWDNAFPADAPLSSVRASAGIGLRYLLVDQIPLLLDYGMALDRRPSEGFGSLHFNLGYTF